jgi:hypothetical protein
MKLTKADLQDGAQEALRAFGMQPPLPMQSLRFLTAAQRKDCARTHSITSALITDFVHPDGEMQYLSSLPLWLWNIRIQPDLLLSIPVWRGKKPFDGELETDEAALKVVKRCFADGGIDILHIAQWITQKMGAGK